MITLRDFTADYKRLRFQLGGNTEAVESTILKAPDPVALVRLASKVFNSGELIQREHRGRGFFHPDEFASTAKVLDEYRKHYYAPLRALQHRILVRNRVDHTYGFIDVLDTMFLSEERPELEVQFWAAVDARLWVYNPFISVDRAVKIAEKWKHRDVDDELEHFSESWNALVDIVGLGAADPRARFVTLLKEGEPIHKRFLEVPVVWYPRRIPRRAMNEIERIRVPYEQAARNHVLGFYEASMFLGRTALEAALKYLYSIDVLENLKVGKLVALAERRFTYLKKHRLHDWLDRANKVVHDSDSAKERESFLFLAVIKGVVEECPSERGKR